MALAQACLNEVQFSPFPGNKRGGEGGHVRLPANLQEYTILRRFLPCLRASLAATPPGLRLHWRPKT